MLAMRHVAPKVLQALAFLQGHPYRNVLDLRHGASTSLIELEFASHTGKDSDTDSAVPAGLPFYTLKAQLRELELVFLNRFLQVCLSHCPAPKILSATHSSPS